ncbi:S8 family serine peptidase [Candidatus Pacearchaeota archaeon]|nr:S8 family serine peptidase [Candidatus Pacearchaeota archaeon]
MNNNLKERKVEIKKIQESGISDVLDSGFRIRNRFQLIPSVSGYIDKENLEALRNSSIIESIELVTEVYSSLDKSAEIINATQVIEDLNFTGEGVTICVVDSGVNYTHHALGGCFGEGCKVKEGHDYVNNDGDPMDDNGHRTHVAGIAAAQDETSSNNIEVK